MALRENDQLPSDFVGGNHFDKYGSKNPIHRILVNGFLGSARLLLQDLCPRRVLEVGCASGDLAMRLFDPSSGAGRIEYHGIDISARDIERARANCPNWTFTRCSAYELPFAEGTFDLVIACEILEHLEDPERCLGEIGRVCSRGAHILISVPWEPTWRFLNMIRGKYWSRFGNTPGHVQHFSRSRIRALVGKWFSVAGERHPFPWTMLLARHDQRRPAPP